MGFKLFNLERSLLSSTLMMMKISLVMNTYDGEDSLVINTYDDEDLSCH